MLVPAPWQLLGDSGFCVRLLMPDGKEVAILHSPPSHEASLRPSRDPQRGGEKGGGGRKQVLMAQPLLRCYPEILTRGESQSSRACVAKGSVAFESHGTFCLVHPGLTQPGPERAFAMQ